MTELLKQLGEVEINLKLLEAKKTSLTRQILEQLKNEQPVETTQNREAEATTKPHSEDQPQGTPIY